MPRKLKLLLLASALAAPLCGTDARPARQAPAAAPAQQTNAADEEFERAKRLFAQGDAAAAAAALKPIAERRKTDDQAWYHLGLALTHSGKPKDGRKAFERALKLRPDWAEARAGFAYALLLSGKPRDARREAERALASDPRRADARYVIGVVSYQVGRFGEAVEAGEQALQLDREFRAAARLVGEALLNVYIEEGDRAARRHPLPKGADDATKLAVFARRDAEREPVKAKMRATAERLEALAGTLPAGAQADALRELARTLKFYALAARDAAGAFLPADVSTKAVITSKPEPAYTPDARARGTAGTVRLRAVLAADATVQNIVVIKGLPDGLTEQAVKAARKIKFAPATLDGRPVSQFVMLEYNFNIY